MLDVILLYGIAWRRIKIMRSIVLQTHEKNIIIVIIVCIILLFGGGDNIATSSPSAFSLFLQIAHADNLNCLYIYIYITAIIYAIDRTGSYASLIVISFRSLFGFIFFALARLDIVTSASFYP